MAGNSFGTLFTLTSYGESHGVGIGGVIEGCPPGLELDLVKIQADLSRRRPGQSKITTPRDEKDEVEFLSGIFEGKTTGTPIGFLIRNKDQRPKDYSALKDVYRPSHADYTYEQKYGLRDYRGGGRQSARETIARVAAGAIAKQILKQVGVEIYAFTSQVASIKLNKDIAELDFSQIENNLVRCPDPETAEEMIELIDKARIDGDSLGGTISCVVKNPPVGLGEPVFDKLHAVLGHAMLSINAVKGFEIGSGFGAASMTGSQHNDEFIMENDRIRTRTNRSGGVQGGISNGEDIYFTVAFKPIATIKKEQHTVNRNKEEVSSKAEGRHDPCVLPRAVPIVEAMAAMVLADFYLINKTYR